MHISEGFLPLAHSALWTAAAAPFVLDSARHVRRISSGQRRFELAAAGGILLLLTALKIPSVAGSSSHPTGIALAAILFGPRAVPVLCVVVLVLQALVLAHGGLTTLGANLFSLGIAGAFVASWLYRGLKAVGIPVYGACWAAAAVSSVAVYGVTSLQLALAFPDPGSGVSGAAMKFAAVFAWTQIPIAITEGFLTSAALKLLARSRADAGLPESVGVPG